MAHSRQSEHRPAAVSKLLPTQEARRIRRRGLYMGTVANGLKSAAEGAPPEARYLLTKHLRTHLHVLGPTGVGKTRLLLWLFQLLTYTKRPIILIDPKGGLFRQARDWCLANGFRKRLALFDLSSHILPGYNPLRENGLSVALQAKWVRESIKSAWGQDSFDQTPQLQRFLYLTLFVARACSLNMLQALDILRPGSALRARVLPEISDPFVRGALQYFDDLSVRRQEELGASTLARLESFVCDDLVQPVITSTESLDIEAILAERKIFLINFAKYQPILPDDLKLLGRMLVNDLLAHVYKGHGEGQFDENHPCYVIIDEVQNVATRQLCDAFDEGRGIGFHTIVAHQFLQQLADEEKSGYLLHSLKNDARTKILFGDCDTEDLEVLAKDLFIDRLNPWRIKDELSAPIFAPVESTRESYSSSRSRSRGRSESTSQSLTNTNSKSLSRGASRSVSIGNTNGKSRSTTDSTSESRGRTAGRAVSIIESVAASEAHGDHYSEGESSMSSWSDSAAMSSGMGAVSGFGETQSPMGETMVFSMHDARSESSAAVVSSAMGGGSGRTSAQGASYIQATSRGRAVAETESIAESESESVGHAETSGDSESRSLTVQQGYSESQSEGSSVGTTNGATTGWSEEEGESEGVSVAPFYEYHREEHVTSRTYMTLDEQIFLAVQQLKMLPKAHFLLKAPGSSAVFLRAPFVPDPRISARRLDAGLDVVYSSPGYFPRYPAPHSDLTQPPALPAAPTSTDAPRQALIPEVLPPAQAEGNDMTDEDFLQ